MPIQAYWWECEGIAQVLQYYRDKVVCGYDERKDLRTKLPYEIDGIVLKINNRAYWSLIEPKRTTPGYARVHKPIPWISGVESVVKAITVQVGRTGVLTPVAELNPVFVQGSTVSRATLHNANEITAKDIRIGDTVIVRKAGMVIPEVVEVVKEKRQPGSRPFDFVAHIQNKCPACGHIISKQKVHAGKKEEVAWRCENLAECPAQRARRIALFAQRSALDIEGLGGVVAEKLSESECVKDPLALFGLDVQRLSSLNLGTKTEPRNFGEKNATRVIKAIDRARSLPLARWLHALGIPNVGEKIAYEIARLHRDFEDLASSDLVFSISEVGKKNAAVVSALHKRLAHNPSLQRQVDLEKIRLEAEIAVLESQWGAELDSKKRTQIRSKIKCRKGRLLTVGLTDEISSVVAKSLVDYFTSQAGDLLLSQLKQFGISPKGELAQTKSVFVGNDVIGKTFVLTGTFDLMSRDDVVELIRKRGGNVVGAVSKKSDFVVCGREPGVLKIRDAEKHGVKQIDEKTFFKMLGPLEPKPRQSLSVQQTLF